MTLCVSLFIATNIKDLERYQTMWEVVSSAGSFLAGLAAFIASIAAWQGVDAWKKKLFGETQYATFWDCQGAVREFETAFYDYMEVQQRIASRGIERESKTKDVKTTLERKLRSLLSSFNYLDVLLLNGGYDWIQRGKKMEKALTDLFEFYENAHNPDEEQDQFEKNSGELRDDLHSWINITNTELNKLVKKL